MADNGVLFPRFFKVFLSQTATESFGIPLSFMDYLDDPLPKTATLQGTGGGFWTVSLARIREGVYFTTGWQKFAEDHELKDGEFLTFVYDGHRTFEVSVFGGRSGCKETRAVTQVIQLSDSDSVEDEEETCIDVDDDNSFDKSEEISQSIHQLDDEEETEPDASAVDRNPNTEARTNPHFQTTLKNRIYELLIPSQVVREHSLTFGNLITYIDEEGTMEGERGKWTDDRMCFKNWERICRRNRVRKHVDTVECELLHDHGHVHSIRVHVIRGPAA